MSRSFTANVGGLTVVPSRVAPMHERLGLAQSAGVLATLTGIALVVVQ